MEIVAVRIEDVDQCLCNRLSTYLSPDRRKMLRHFKFPEDQWRSLLSELLVRTYVMEKWGLSNDTITFVKNKFGKPAIAGFPNLQFNLSHSGHWVVAVFDELPVGIDIEEIVPIDLAITDYCFSHLEKKQLDEQPEENTLAHFYKVWTLKESYIKAVGKGLSIPPQSFSIVFVDEKIRLQTSSDNENWCFHQYEIDDSYALSVCARTSVFPEQIHMISSNDLAFRFHNIISN
ncbi:4'-phosphopantetheinyl transferase family protein [Metabacillus halosaccharovorans]|uniref:4'-phosphopantetheinyl transferase family protein n=1 Tax=Metabacillus halosaccharovorans TaxID=930124 RepID=UPI002040BB12|nr:4'-phosphopantetheinyl transferase superfamily protein [Metabacillus halosaccharovorans]MCM3439292.1 4'-phosphopantetheinyl transferase superfamily protein [Metabacillus halosaccharovorans]